MSAECPTHGTDLLVEGDGFFCPSCALDRAEARVRELETALEPLFGSGAGDAGFEDTRGQFVHDDDCPMMESEYQTCVCGLRSATNVAREALKRPSE